MTGYEIATLIALGVYIGFICFIVGTSAARMKLNASIERVKSERDEARKLLAAAERELLLANIDRDAARRLQADLKRNLSNGSYLPQRFRARLGSEVRTAANVNTGVPRTH